MRFIWTKRGGFAMRSFVSKVFAFFAFALLCTVIFPSSAMARPVIKFTIEHVYLHDAGEAEIVGYFENGGDEGAYVKWTDLDLTLIADNGQEMWSDSGIRHYVDDIYVPADQYVAYTFYVQNQGIPEYHGKYNYRWHTSTHWEKAAG